MNPLDGYKSIMESISNLFISSVSIVKFYTYDRLGKQFSWIAKNTSTAGADEIVIYFTWLSSKYLLGLSEAHSIIKNKEQSKKVTKV